MGSYLRYWLVCFPILLTLGTSPVAGQSFLSGDLDGDGRVTSQDVQLLQGYLQGQNSLTNRQIQAADVDGDSQITEQDLAQLQQSRGTEVTDPQGQLQLNSAYSGQVVDRRTGQPLSNVEVTIPEAGVSVKTDNQGRFQLPQSLPENQILMARLENYLPFSQSTSASQSLQLELDRWDPTTTLVLEQDLTRLGDNFYSPDSAGASQFRFPSQGIELVRAFSLTQLPTTPPILRIGSLIGLDTLEAARAGQSKVGGASMSPLVVKLNGTQIQTITLAGDDIRIPLSLNLLRVGSNTIALQTGKIHHQGVARVPVDIPLFGGRLRMNVATGGTGLTQIDYDDIQLANVRLDLPQ